MDLDPNNMPPRAVAKFTRQEDDLLSLWENKDKQLVHKKRQQEQITQKRKLDEKTKVSASNLQS